MEPVTTRARVIVVDAHVHIYSCFDLSYFLDSAYENLQTEARRLRKDDQFTGVLLLTETSEDDWFRRLRSYAENNEIVADNVTREWSFHHTAEACSLLAQSNGQRKLTLVAGRQIVTKENLEVLALATGRTFPDGVPIRDVIDRIKENGGIPVLPWGFGKWWWQRGKIVADFLRAEQVTGVFLGDNSGRPGFWRRPDHFKLARAKGIRILPGSDPLPFPSECKRAGSFGFAVDGILSSDQPAADIKEMLLDPSISITPYGSLETPYRFFRNQILMQLTKRLGRNFA